MAPPGEVQALLDIIIIIIIICETMVARGFLFSGRLINSLSELLCTFLSCLLGWNARPPLDPNVLIERYRQDEMNALALIHNLAQVVQFQLELKETVTPGRVCKNSL